MSTTGSMRNYPVNAWWVAAISSEVTQVPMSRWLLGRPIVLFRTTKGEVVALDDRCAHRGAPLSRGRRVDDDIACPYHGFRYNVRGVCTHVPTQAHVPPTLKVRSYPVNEHGPFVWIWTGDADQADGSALPDIPWSTGPQCLQVRGYLDVRCDYFALQENFMDPAHFDYLHSPPDREWHQPSYQLRPIEIKVTDRTVTVFLSIGREIFTPPGCFVHDLHYEASTLYDDNARAVSGSGGVRIARGAHCTTPISPGRCHWWWAYNLSGFGTDIETVRAQFDAAIQQDRDVLEAIQLLASGDTRTDDATSVLVAADRPVVEVRKLLREMIEADGA